MREDSYVKLYKKDRGAVLLRLFDDSKACLLNTLKQCVLRCREMHFSPRIVDIVENHIDTLRFHGAESEPLANTWNAPEFYVSCNNVRLEVVHTSGYNSTAPVSVFYIRIVSVGIANDPYLF